MRKKVKISFSLITPLVTFIDTTGSGVNPLHSVYFGIATAVITMAISFALSFILYQDPVAEAAAESPSAATEPEEKDAGKPLVKKMVLSSPMTGRVIAVKDVPDQVFAAGILGEGAAIIPTEGKAVAPCDCVVSATMDSRHAIGLTTPDGMEILIHVGLDTVQLNGKFYEYRVAQGDTVKKGDALIEFDMDGITAANKQSILAARSFKSMNRKRREQREWLLQ